MKNASYYRALASLCRQQAAYNPDRCREWLGEAERWEYLAAAEISDHFKECNSNTGLGELADSKATQRWRSLRPSLLACRSQCGDLGRRKLSGPAPARPPLA